MSEVIKMNPSVVELTEQDYQTWKRHPMGIVFFRWVEDRLADYREGAADRIEYGAINEKELAEISTRINFCKELNDLRLENIQAFYQQLEAKSET